MKDVRGGIAFSRYPGQRRDEGVYGSPYREMISVTYLRREIK